MPTNKELIEWVNSLVTEDSDENFIANAQVLRTVLSGENQGELHNQIASLEQELQVSNEALANSKKLFHTTFMQGGQTETNDEEQEETKKMTVDDIITSIDRK